MNDNPQEKAYEDYLTPYPVKSWISRYKIYPSIFVAVIILLYIMSKVLFYEPKAVIAKEVQNNEYAVVTKDYSIACRFEESSLMSVYNKTNNTLQLKIKYQLANNIKQIEINQLEAKQAKNIAINNPEKSNCLIIEVQQDRSLLIRNNSSNNK